MTVSEHTDAGQCGSLLGTLRLISLDSSTPGVSWQRMPLLVKVAMGSHHPALHLQETVSHWCSELRVKLLSSVNEHEMPKPPNSSGLLSAPEETLWLSPGGL